MTDHLAALRKFLASVTPGEIAGTADIEELLSAAWEKLEGGNDTTMSGDKIIGRMENVRWDPPQLHFVIERHGGTVMGSVNAELYLWSVDVEKGTAICGLAGERLVGERQKPFAFKVGVDEICTAIMDGAEEERLNWKDIQKSKVEVLIGKIIPAGSASKQTIKGRRRRFSEILELKLNEHCWEKLSRQNVYGRISN